jgi:DNA-binding MarR family transcriptional regulator
MFTVAVDAASVVVLIFVLAVGGKAVRSFRQSKQAVTESASLIGVVVDALSSRVEVSESIVNEVKSGFEALNHRNYDLEKEQMKLREGYLKLLEGLEEILSNDKKLISELELLKAKVTASHQPPPVPAGTTPREKSAIFNAGGDILGSLTTTERETLEILNREGPKAAPELGRRLKKSREHTSRLMKKLYLEGYVDRESNHAPFRYRVTDTARSAIESSGRALTVKATEKA